MFDPINSLRNFLWDIADRRKERREAYWREVDLHHMLRALEPNPTNLRAMVVDHRYCANCRRLGSIDEQARNEFECTSCGAIYAADADGARETGAVIATHAKREEEKRRANEPNIVTGLLFR